MDMIKLSVQVALWLRSGASVPAAGTYPRCRRESMEFAALGAGAIELVTVFAKGLLFSPGGA